GGGEPRRRRGLRWSLDRLSFGSRAFVTAGTALGPVATVGSVAARGATVAAVSTIAAFTALAVVVALAQLRRRALFEFLDAQRQYAQNVLVEALLALHFGDRRRRGVDVHQREMRLAVLLDPVGEGL